MCAHLSYLLQSCHVCTLLLSQSHADFVIDSKKQLSRTTTRSSIAQGTIETDNKRRPVLMKKGSQRFEPPPPEPPDPNSGTNSIMQQKYCNLYVCTISTWFLLSMANYCITCCFNLYVPHHAILIFF